MKAIKRNFLAIYLIFISGFIFSQAPQAFKYQAVARNAAGALLSNTNLTVRAGVRDLLVTGIIVYQETHAVATNSFGLININIGKGTVTSGTFTAINWGTGDKFIEIEIDYGTGFVSMGISQLLSVPYALYAANGPTGPQGPQGLQGIQGIQGIQGMNGLPLNWLGSFAVSPGGPSLNDAYYDITQKKSFVWNGTSWQILAQDGAIGPPGSSIAMPNIEYLTINDTVSTTTDFGIIASSAAVANIRLPLISSVPKGKVIVLKRPGNISFGTASYNIITLGSDQIEFVSPPTSSLTIIQASMWWGLVRLVSDGISKWYVW